MIQFQVAEGVMTEKLLNAFTQCIAVTAYVDGDNGNYHIHIYESGFHPSIVMFREHKNFPNCTINSHELNQLLLLIVAGTRPQDYRYKLTELGLL
jgi:hypothetical protein